MAVILLPKILVATSGRWSLTWFLLLLHCYALPFVIMSFVCVCVRAGGERELGVSICLPAFLSVYLYVYLTCYLSVYLSIYPSTYLSVGRAV